MPSPLKLVGVIIVLGAPAPALAQPTLAAIGNNLSSQVTDQRPVRAEPVSFAERQAVAAAPFEKPGPRVLNLTVRGDDKLRDDVELRVKDAWTDDQGLRLTPTRVAYKRRFSPAWYTPVEISGLYWHFVDIVWIFLFPLLYLIGAHYSAGH